MFLVQIQAHMHHGRTTTGMDKESTDCYVNEPLISCISNGLINSVTETRSKWETDMGLDQRMTKGQSRSGFPWGPYSIRFTACCATVP